MLRRFGTGVRPRGASRYLTRPCSGSSIQASARRASSARPCFRTQVEASPRSIALGVLGFIAITRLGSILIAGRRRDTIRHGLSLVLGTFGLKHVFEPAAAGPARPCLVFTPGFPSGARDDLGQAASVAIRCAEVGRGLPHCGIRRRLRSDGRFPNDDRLWEDQLHEAPRNGEASRPDLRLRAQLDSDVSIQETGIPGSPIIELFNSNTASNWSVRWSA